MREVAILGAGEVGGLIAHVLARRDAADVIRLIDERGRIAEGKALDITQAAPIEQFSARVAGSNDVSDAAAAHVIVVADRAGGGEWALDEGLLLLKRVHAMAPRALILCGGASHRELVERGVRDLHLSRARIIGSAPEALIAAARALIALEIDVSPREVALSILGVPPSGLVVVWEDSTVAGFGITRVLTEPRRRELDARIRALWPPGPYALASAAAKAIEIVRGRSRRLATCFVAPDDTAGVRARAAALPLRLGPSGVVETVLPSLSASERVALDNAMLL